MADMVLLATHGHSGAARVAASALSCSLRSRLEGEDLEGEVLSVHRRAVNLRLGGRLVTVADASLGAMPHAVSVPGLRPLELGVCAGERVSAGRGLVRLGAAAVVDTVGAAAWSARLGALPCPPDLRSRADLLAAAARRLPVIGLRAVLDEGTIATGRDADPWLAAAAPAIARLARAVASGDTAGAAASGMGLIGLGPGLTPSGDDLLVGLTAALAATGDGRAGRLAATWAGQAPRLTGEVAAAFHGHAADGEYAERLHLLLGALLAGAPDGIAAAVARAAAWGATSGIDTLAGVAIALRGRIA